MRRLSGLLAAFVFVSAVPAVEPARAALQDDAYLAGYVAAILEREFDLAAPEVVARDGAIVIRAQGIDATRRDRIKTVLSKLSGVTAVRIEDSEAPETSAEAGAAPVPPVETGAGPAESEAAANEGRPAEQGLEVLPPGRLFDPLLADPRWAHFSAGYHYYLDDDEIEHVGAVSFGETFGLLRGPAPAFGDAPARWQLDFQAAVFGIFDLDSDSMDLVNADYWVGLPLSYRDGPFSALLRVFHQSSHLGDEFLLRSRVDRVNLSYEALDLKLSYDVGGGLRLYGGAGYLLHKEPSDLDPWSTQLGAEYLLPRTFFSGLVRPMAAVDLQQREESDWRTDLSLRAGVQFESPDRVGQRVQLLIEYFNGHSPNGQFYDRAIEYVGIGAHVYLY